MAASDGCALPAFNADSAEIARLLVSARTIAVVGLSPDPGRPSHDVAAYLKRAGYRIIPVNPNAVEILGERSVPSLAEAPGAVDIVDVFRRPEAVPDIVREAIAKGAKAVWMQPGIVHNDAARTARDAGLLVVMNRCLKVEHARLAAAGVKAPA